MRSPVKMNFYQLSIHTVMQNDWEHETETDIIIIENGIKKLLLALNPHKEAGPYNLTPRVLKEMTFKVTPILTMTLRRSYDSAVLILPCGLFSLFYILSFV